MDAAEDFVKRFSEFWADPSPAEMLRRSATVGGRRLQWPAVDRFVMRGDEAMKRVTCFDAPPFVGRVPTSPSAWPAWWRSCAGRPWS